MKILVITAHPDDVDFGAGGTIASWIAEGHEVVYCLVTDGQAGGSVVVLGSGAAGSFIGSLSAEWASETFPRRAIALLSFGLTALSMAFAALVVHPIVGLASLFTGAFLFQILRVRSDASIQANVEPSALGQVFATYDIVYNLAFITGGIAGVSLAPVTPYSVVIGTIVVTYVTLAVVFAIVIKDGKESALDQASANDVPRAAPLSAKN